MLTLYLKLINILMIKSLGVKNDLKRLNSIVYTTLEIIRKISFMLYPVIPSSALKALEIFQIDEKDITFSSLTDHKYLKQGNPIKKIGILFKKILKE